MTNPTNCGARWQLAAGCMAVLLIGASACDREEYETVPDNDIDAARRDAAEQFGNRIMQAWARDEYPTVGDEAVAAFRDGHNDVERQKTADKAVEDQYGNFQSMSFHQVKRSKPARLEVTASRRRSIRAPRRCR